MRIFKYLMVILLISSSCESFFNEDISSEEVVVLAPVDGVVVNQNPIGFRWEPVEFALDYQLQIAQPGFQNATRIVLDTILRQTFFEQPLEVGNYEWRIKARNPEYETAFFLQGFRNASDLNFSDQLPVLLTPIEASATNNIRVDFDWADLDNAVEYRWRIRNSGTIVGDENVTDSEISYTLSDGDYEWEVQATNGSENTGYATRSLTIDTQSPETPVLSAPLDDSVSVSGNLDFSWDRADLPGSREIDSVYIYTDQPLDDLFEKQEGINNSASINAIPSGLYYWRVISYDEAGNVGQSSNVFSFTVN